MAFTLITVTHGPIKNLDGSAASGVIAFKLSGRMTNGTQSYASEVPVHSTLDGSGDLSQVLPANNDPATVPQGTTYEVIFLLNGAGGSALSGDRYEITVPYDADGGTVDLGSLLPSQVAL